MSADPETTWGDCTVCGQPCHTYGCDAAPAHRTAREDLDATAADARCERIEAYAALYRAIGGDSALRQLVDRYGAACFNDGWHHARQPTDDQ